MRQVAVLTVWAQKDLVHIAPADGTEARAVTPWLLIFRADRVRARAVLHRRKSAFPSTPGLV